MKKLLLLASICAIGCAANAQFVARHTGSPVLPITKKMVDLSGPIVTSMPARHAAAKTTAPAFYTQDFSGGLPSGWTTGVISGPGTWHHTTVASTSSFHLAALASTTAANGWMIFDSDSLGAACGTCAPAGWMQTDAINCAAHTTVRLNFQELYRKYNDSCVIWVSTSPTFTTYTRFPVSFNNSLATNVSTVNPKTLHINITSAAASSATVYIRFVHYGYPAGSYSWSVDDMTLSEVDPHDVDAHASFLYNPQATAYNSSMFTTPLQFVDSIYPVILLSNQGANVESPVVGAQIYNGATAVYTQTMPYAGLAVGAEDSIVQFPGFKPTAMGNYSVPMGANITGDADLTNNVDSSFFTVSDTTWMVNSGKVSGSYYLHRVSPAQSYLQGARFDVPSTAVGDTVSGFGVAFASTSVPTTGSASVSVQLYSVQQAGTNWNFVATSVSKPILASDISSTTSTVWAYFAIDPVASGGVAQFILQPGTTYAAVAQINGVTTDLLVLSSASPNATGFAGYFGQSDSSLNDGGNASFGLANVATGLTSVPMVRMYFSNIGTVGVNDINKVAILTKATPNPATSDFTVSFTQAVPAAAVVSITNTVGQVVATQNVAATTSGSTTFSTANLPAGVYFYSVNADGGRATGRIVVAH